MEFSNSCVKVSRLTMINFYRDSVATLSVNFGIFVKILHAYEYRISPTNEPKVLFAKTFDCCCYFFYNQTLNLKITVYKARIRVARLQ